MLKLFSCDYDHYERYGEMSPKCEFWRDEYWFWSLLGTFKEYIKQNIIVAVLRKAYSHWVALRGKCPNTEFFHAVLWFADL